MKPCAIYFTSQNELPRCTLEVVALFGDIMLYQLFDNKILAAGSLRLNDVLNQVESKRCIQTLQY
jgi:hypothetical protein